MKYIKFNILIGLWFILISSGYAANVNVTTKYGDTGGIVGAINAPTDKINGNIICPNDPTPGCDFDADPKWNNNNTVDDPSDDFYTGDLLVRTNDNFQAIAGWTWNGTPSVGEDEVTITGTLPVTMPGSHQYYEWTQLPGTCDLATSSISADKQTIICVRKGFDSGGTGTKSEDLTFNVRVKGGTPDGATPGDITFKIESQNATPVTDTTDGNSLTVTAGPRWNLEKSAYTILAGQEYDVDGDGTPEKGWIMDYKFYIESDEVTRGGGEIDNVNPIVGNESMGDDATFTFTDDMSAMPPNAVLIDCSMNGRYTNRDGYVGSADPITCFGAGCIRGTTFPERHILAAKGEQVITCAQTLDQIFVQVEHVDATLDHYPTKTYAGNDLPVTRAIAAIGSIYIFIPLDDVKNGENGVDDGCQQGTAGCDDGKFSTKNIVKDFDPTTPTGNSNFGDDPVNGSESEKDNYYDSTLYYASGNFSKYLRGGFATKPTQNTTAGYIASTYRSGDGLVTTGAEFSTWLTSNNRGGTAFTEASGCDVFDAYRYKLQAVQDNGEYTTIQTVYTGKPEWPYRMVIYGDDGNFTDANGADELPFIVEYASTYVDKSFLASQGGDTTVAHTAQVLAECTAPDADWTTDFDSVKNANGGRGVTKVRYRLKPGFEYPSGAGKYLLLNHEARVIDFETNQPLQQNDLLVNYAANKYNYYDNWVGPTYTPGVYPGNHSGSRGDRYIITGPKVRIKKHESRTTASPGIEVTYTLETSYTDDIGSSGSSGQVTVTDVLPKDFNYVVGSTVPLAEFGDPTLGTCADVLDINVTPCVNGENQVLIWDYGIRPVNDPGIADLNYTVLIGASANVGVNTNAVKIESPTDASPVSQRKAEIGLTIDVPASINIVKSTEENPAYPSKRERTTDPKDIFFLMDMRNGKNGDITDLDVIDILPFIGDGGDGAIKFNDLNLKRNIATDYHGTMVFHEASFSQHPGSSSTCDMTANGGVKYYYTNAIPTTINMAPTVGDANDVTHANTIWCEGDASGPNGCAVGGVALTNATVTAVRARGPRMEKQSICQFRVHVTVDDNLMGDNYSNSAGASATGITLPVLSNSVAVPIVGSTLGNLVWYDANKDGVQDPTEDGIAGVIVHLLDGNGDPVNDPTTGQPYIVTTDADGKYLFTNLNHGDYQVKFEPLPGYIVSPKEANGNSETDSNVNTDSNTTDTISLGIDANDLTVDMGLFTPVISGNIFNDGDGDANVNGAAISAPDGTQLHATLLDENGAVLATTPIAADGTYSFDGADGVRANTNYSVVLSTTPSATTSDLPANWNNTGQNLNDAGAGNDGTNDGKISVSVGVTDVPQVDFGINEKPVANDVTEPTQINLVDGQTAVVPGLNVSDREDGTPTTITIETLPDAATQGVLYYNGTPVTAGQVIPNFDPLLLTVDPINAGAGIPSPTVVFTYTTTDAAGVKSDPATVTMPFTAPTISGNIFSDGNGDGNINGTPISKPSGIQLFVTLLDSNGVAIFIKPVAADGTYYFDVNNGVEFDKNYTLVLTDDINANATAHLPTGWNNADGENVNSILPTGNDGQVNGAGDGSIDITGPTAANPNIPLVDFGINHAPVANDETKPAVLNPGGTTQATVPPLNYADDEDGIPSTITIKTLPDPATGVLYYNGTAVTAGQVIPNFDPALLTVDPTDGEPTVVFTYTTTDAAGVESNEATVTMPFTGLTISGNIFNDGDGDADVNGSAISAPDGTQLHATLLDANGAVLATTPIAADGTYSFDGTDGVTANTAYSIVLATTADANVSDLPANWNNTGENINSAGAGNDGTPDGAIPVSVGTVDIPQIDFGINHKPVATDVTEPTQHNPGGTTQVQVPNLVVTDTEDGTPTTITIKTLPDPATGVLYYNGTPVTVGQVIPNFDPALFTVDPTDGDQTVVFDYTTTDAAGIESDPATVTLPFTGLIISGNVFNDGDANANVNGAAIPTPDGTQLHATLLDANGAVLATTPIAADGSYSFDGTDGVAQNSVYSIVLATTPDATASNLPANWNNTGEKENNTGTGKDASANGIVSVSVGTGNVPNNDFGINKKPVATNVTEPTQPSPRGTTRVQVPNLSVSDREDGTPTTVTITTLPTNATLYYNGTPVTAGQVIPNFNNALLTVDPIDGDITVVFNYTTTDAAGATSDPATVTMPFIMVNGSWRGNVSEDTNGDGKGDTPIVGVLITLYVDDNGNGRLDSGETTVAGSTRTNANGDYAFTNLTPGAYLAVQTQPSGYSDVSEREGGLDGDITNNVINVVAGIVSSGEADIGNDFVERVSASVPHVCTCNPCCSTTQTNMSTSEINRDSVNLTWNRPQGAVSGFIIYQNNTRIAIVGPGARGYTVNGLNPNTKYHFRIEAFTAYHIYEFGNIIVETKEKDDYGWLPAIYNILL